MGRNKQDRIEQQNGLIRKQEKGERKKTNIKRR
jgi:hypothetical protein